MSIDETLKRIMNETDVGTIHALAMAAYDKLPEQPDDSALRLLIGRWSAEHHIDMMSDSGLDLIERLRPYLRATKRESIALDDIQVGDCVEYRSGWIAKVFDITDITTLEDRATRASARIWTRAEGREWYHTHRRDGVSTTDAECDIQRIIKAKSNSIEVGGSNENN